MKISSLLCLMSILVGLSSGCSDPCNDLQAVCDRCAEDYKELCQAVVDGGDVQSCSNQFALFDDKCP